MTKEEETILSTKNVKHLFLDCKKKYSDEFYERYVENFKHPKKRKLVYRIVKRSFDIVVSFISLVLLLIPFFIIGIIIKIDSKGPVFFKSRRVGMNRKVFYCLKFRSMSINAPAEMATSVFEDAHSYVTRVGRLLRKTSIDELPQLFNVFAGQMSIIGYRPLVPTEENCNEMREKLGVFRMRPGISGFAQVHGRDDVYYKNKAIMDAHYVSNACIGMDISLVFKSVLVVLSKKGNEDDC